ncbi:MAG: DNA (cytosine-5-)-methyltransferase [Eubacteriales bacterium]|nr:DNA (cytosine-5-)-methyltransferase [Eubacteriales bacterium]
MKFLDFFSGIGGFRLGMEMAGHECLGHCEIDKYANKSYAAMHNPKEGEWFADNIRDVQPGDLPEADVYCFGFPCQAFSIAGNRGGFEDTRGTLFFEVMRLAAVRKPKYLFAENVAGLLSHDGGRTFGTIISTLGELGYWWEYQVLNSKDFGVPQNRERVFIIGHLGKRSGQEIFPISGIGTEITEKDCILSDSGQGRHWRKQNFFSALRVGGDVQCVDVSGIYTQTSENFRRPPLKNYSRCLKANMHDAGVVLEDKTIRKLIPRECFRLQGFSDTYFEKAASVNSETQLYKQAGNSVTVNVIHEIAKRLGN